MTTNRLLTTLFRAVAAENFSLATSAALELCKAEETKGHHAAARQLRGALKGTSGGAVTSHRAAEFLSSALVRLENSVSWDSVVLAPSARIELDGVVKEWNRASELRRRGIFPRSKLLFHGPPGCGKSLTAQALGSALDLPVYLVRFDAVIGAFLGQTAIHLRQLFHFAETTPCVLLLDELDALGKRRGNPLDVGELDRIVISLLQELEHAQPMGVVVATTNLATHLDDALWRRFDLDIPFNRPSKLTLRAFVNGLSKKYDSKFSKEVVDRAVGAPSFAEAEKMAVAEVRRQIISS